MGMTLKLEFVPKDTKELINLFRFCIFFRTLNLLNVKTLLKEDIMK